MKKLQVKLLLTKELCEKIGDVDFYNRLRENKIKPKELELFIIKNQCNDFHNLIETKVKSETGFTTFNSDFIKIENIKTTENEIEVQVDLKVRDKSKSKLLHPFDFIVKKNKK